MSLIDGALLLGLMLSLCMLTASLVMLGRHMGDANRVFCLVEKQSKALTWTNTGCQEALAKLEVKLDALVSRVDDLARRLDSLTGRGP